MIIILEKITKIQERILLLSTPIAIAYSKNKVILLLYLLNAFLLIVLYTSSLIIKKDFLTLKKEALWLFLFILVFIIVAKILD